MKFVSKDLALKLKEKGFDKPCFGYYGNDELIMNYTSIHLPFGGNVYDTMFSFNGLRADDAVDAPTTEQVLEWLREEKDIDIVIYPIDRNTIFMGGEKYILSIYFCGKRDYKIHKDNNDKFVKWEDACIAGINFVVEHLI